MSFSKKPSNRFVIFIVVFIILLSVGLSSTLRSTTQYLLGWLTRPLYNLSQNLKDRLVSKEGIINENVELYKRLENITVDYSRLKELEYENEILRTELNYLDQTNYKYQIADITSGTNLPNLDILIINKGAVHGLQEGMPVVHSDGIMIGKIYKVDKFTSQIILVNNNNSSISAVVQNEEFTPGIVNGRHNLAMIMEFIEQDQQIATEQTIITSGREEFIPSGLVIGQITSVNKLDNDFFQSATVSSPVKMTTIKQVVVLTQIDE